MKSVVTDHYTANVTIDLTEHNSYGDKLNDNVVTMTYKVKVNKPEGLAFLITQLSAAIQNVNEVNR